MAWVGFVEEEEGRQSRNVDGNLITDAARSAIRRIGGAIPTNGLYAKGGWGWSFDGGVVVDVWGGNATADVIEGILPCKGRQPNLQLSYDLLLPNILNCRLARPL